RLMGVWGISSIALTIFVFLLIWNLQWSPADAEAPVAVILLGYELIIVPMGLFTLYRMLTDDPTEAPPSPVFQFKLRTILLITVFCGFLFGAVKASLDQGLPYGTAIATSFFAGTVFATGAVLVFASRHQRRESDFPFDQGMILGAFDSEESPENTADAPPEAE
ncbi:MAG: hypothetical protein N2C14_28240, partial [Planctomycetales bacterium]